MTTLEKKIITCAVTGSIHTPSMSPYLPITPEQIVEAAVGASEAGAAIVHLHARDPDKGLPDQSARRFVPILSEIKRRSDCIINITTGGSAGMTLDQRLEPALKFRPEIASLNMGSMNFGLFPMLDRLTTVKHDWEKKYLESSRDRVFRNTFADIETVLHACSQFNVQFEFECYDIGHLYSLAYFADRQLIRPPFFIQTVFGVLGGIGAHPDDISFMRQTANRLFGRNTYHWSALGTGKNQFKVAATSIVAGGHVRVGLEDSLWIGPGKLAQSNAEQVFAVKSLIETLGYQVATSSDVRELLDLKGSAHVAF